MIYVSLDELLPTAKQYDIRYIAIIGVICGMGVMALSLLLFLKENERIGRCFKPYVENRIAGLRILARDR